MPKKNKVLTVYAIVKKVLDEMTQRTNAIPKRYHTLYLIKIIQRQIIVAGVREGGGVE